MIIRTSTPTPSSRDLPARLYCHTVSKRETHMLKVFCVTLQTDEACGRSVHQRIQQTPRAALGAEVPGVSDREAGQVGDL